MSYTIQEPKVYESSFLNNPLEQEKICQAKEYIMRRLNAKLSIASISRHVGTNQCYLKKGFKEMFGQSVFGFVQECKMKKAKQLLSNPKYSVSEVAYKLNYACLSSFSQAYKRYYGVCPSGLRD
jgi:AraC family transcriptional regulator